ncbi:hypothetical protein E8E14_007447 [Neopestalotiopsis sp. 37M]|nr:hypothetical protein E8E14_007447 [Neopestalotiopsis sp. 37M]
MPPPYHDRTGIGPSHSPDNQNSNPRWRDNNELSHTFQQNENHQWQDNRDRAFSQTDDHEDRGRIPYAADSVITNLDQRPRSRDNRSYIQDYRRRSPIRDRRRSPERQCSPHHAIENKNRGAFPSTIRTYGKAPPGSWSPLSKDEFIHRWMHDRNTIPEMPKNRSTIWHEQCGQVHAPELCRGPINKGLLNNCIFCGGKDHITDLCHYFVYVPKEHRAMLRVYLHVYARQGLPPVASAISFEKVPIGVAHRCNVAVLSKTATRIYLQRQSELDKAAGRPFWYETFDYSRLSTPSETVQWLPQSDPCLGDRSGVGPPAFRVGHGNFKERGSPSDVHPYNEMWTLFVNDHIPPRVTAMPVVIPDWVNQNGDHLVEYPPGHVQPEFDDRLGLWLQPPEVKREEASRSPIPDESPDIKMPNMD